MKPPNEPVISNIQALRAFAALGVVFFHTSYVIPGTVQTDFSGVMIFFVISGFIMTHITRQSDEKFMASRLIRIVPLYWIATVFSFFYFGLGFANPTYTFPVWWHFLSSSPKHLAIWFSNQLSALCTAEAAIHLATSMLFIPTAAPPLLGVGWTLNIEMFFYVVFWVSLTISRRFGPLIACAVLIAFKVTPLHNLGAPGALYAHRFTSGFIIGVGVYYAWMLFESWKTRVNRVAVYCAVGVSWAGFLASARTGGFIQTINLPYATLLALIVFGALALHSTGARISMPWLLLLGDASYALYLIHLNVLETMRAASSEFHQLDTSRSVGAMGFAMISCSLLAMGCYLAIERPLLRTLKRRVMAWRPEGSQPISASESSVRVEGRPPVLPSPAD